MKEIFRQNNFLEKKHDVWIVMKKDFQRGNKSIEPLFVNLLHKINHKSWMIKNCILLLLKLYKKCLSPLLGNNCRFYPSCSDYMYTAVNRFGIFKGVFLGTKRILKCNPLHPGGIDYVPENYKVIKQWTQKN